MDKALSQELQELLSRKAQPTSFLRCSAGRYFRERTDAVDGLPGAPLPPPDRGAEAGRLPG